MEPVRLSFRRLEERRVLDASAVFASGALGLQLNDAESVTIGAQNGNLVVTDSNQDVVDIKDQSGSTVTVGISDVDSLKVTGDAAVN